MYYTDAPTLTVDAFDFDIATGGLENRRILITCGRRVSVARTARRCMPKAACGSPPRGYARFDGSHRRAIALEVIDVPTSAPGSRPVVPVRTVDPEERSLPVRLRIGAGALTNALRRQAASTKTARAGGERRRRRRLASG